MSGGHWSDGVPSDRNPAARGEAPIVRDASRPRVPCARCGYDIAGQRLGDPCPECGEPVRQFPLDARTNSGMAVASMILGIVSVIGCMAYGVLSIICGPLAIWFSIKAKRAIREDRAARSSGGMATAGLVCGIVGTVIGGLYFLVMVVFVGLAIFAASSSASHSSPMFP